MGKHTPTIHIILQRLGTLVVYYVAITVFEKNYNAIWKSICLVTVVIYTAEMIFEFYKNNYDKDIDK